VGALIRPHVRPWWCRRPAGQGSLQRRPCVYEHHLHVGLRTPPRSTMRRSLEQFSW